ncbi:hypothetical protein N0V87_008798 [Didymella glomerata]|uniref:Uncharacterized protein n=1 Tax=Didymella glomerata TaxID=749621 RepID=A0A9W9BVT3_9PLEO|nr:hypothetical protein N0V87_008798 [Didymella glomerata]
MKTLYSKLEKLSEVYDADIYFVARRNGRIVECVSADAADRKPWSPPDRAALNRYYPPPATKLLVHAKRAGCRGDRKSRGVGQAICDLHE